MFAKSNSVFSKRPSPLPSTWGGGGYVQALGAEERLAVDRVGDIDRGLPRARWEDAEVAGCVRGEGPRRRVEPGPSEGWLCQTPRAPSAPPPPPHAPFPLLPAPPSPSSPCLSSSRSATPARAAAAGRGRGGGASGSRSSRPPRASRTGAEIPARPGRTPRGGPTTDPELRREGLGGREGCAETRPSCTRSVAAQGAPRSVGGRSVPAPRPRAFFPAPTPSPACPVPFPLLRILRDRPWLPPGLALPLPSRAPCWSHRFLLRASWSLCLAA